jgi:hypothetical protein
MVGIQVNYLRPPILGRRAHSFNKQLPIETRIHNLHPRRETVSRKS